MADESLNAEILTAGAVDDIISEAPRVNTWEELLKIAQLLKGYRHNETTRIEAQACGINSLKL